VEEVVVAVAVLKPFVVARSVVAASCRKHL